MIPFASWLMLAGVVTMGITSYMHQATILITTLTMKTRSPLTTGLATGLEPNCPSQTCMLISYISNTQIYWVFGIILSQHQCTSLPKLNIEYGPHVGGYIIRYAYMPWWNQHLNWYHGKNQCCAMLCCVSKCKQQFNMSMCKNPILNVNDLHLYLYLLVVIYQTLHLHNVRYFFFGHVSVI